MELPEHQRNRADQYSGDYPVTIDRTYAVGGMMISENRLLFLIRDDDGAPLFAPAAFFDFTVQDIPAGWKFALTPGIRVPNASLWNHPVSAVWGYPDLVDDVRHVAALGDGDRHALAVFDKYVF